MELQALENLQTVLAAISTGGGYKSDVDACELHYRTWETFSQAGNVVIGIVPVETQVQGYQGHRLRCQMRVDLACHVQGTTHASIWQAVEDLIDDVIAAVGADPTLTQTVIDTVPVSWQTDIGDPDNNQHFGRSGTAVITLRIRYERSTSGS